jgi:hypothetical protein
VNPRLAYLRMKLLVSRYPVTASVYVLVVVAAVLTNFLFGWWSLLEGPVAGILAVRAVKMDDARAARQVEP